MFENKSPKTVSTGIIEYGIQSGRSSGTKRQFRKLQGTRHQIEPAEKLFLTESVTKPVELRAPPTTNLLIFLSSPTLGVTKRIKPVDHPEHNSPTGLRCVPSQRQGTFAPSPPPPCLPRRRKLPAHLDEHLYQLARAENVVGLS